MVFRSIVLALLLSAVYGQTHIQRIIGVDAINYALYGIGMDADGDWMCASDYKNHLHFMKWTGASYDDAGRQAFLTTGAYHGSNIRLRGNWAIVGGSTDKTEWYLKTGDTWALDHTITWGTRTKYYPDIYMHGFNQIAMSIDGTRAAVYDNTGASGVGSIRFYSLSGGAWGLHGTGDVEVDGDIGGDATDMKMSGDGNKIVICSSVGEKCIIKKFDAGTWDNTVQIIVKADSVEPYKSATSPFGVATEFNTDGSLLMVTQNKFNNVAGYVIVFEESSTDTYTYMQTIIDDANIHGSTMPDALGSDIRYYDGLWYLSDGMHSESEYTKPRRGACFVYSLDPNGIMQVVYDLKTNDLPSEVGYGNDAGFGHRVVPTGDRVLVYVMFADIASLTNTGDGSIEVFMKPEVTPYPTTAPVVSPTAAPTQPQFAPIGSVKIGYNMVVGAARKTATSRAIGDVRKKLPPSTVVEVTVKSTETSSVPSGLIDQVGEEAFKTSFAKSRGCLVDCVVTLSRNDLRVLADTAATAYRQLAGSIVVSLDFTLSEEAYNTLITTGNDLDDPAFLDTLAAELGINATDIALTVVGGVVQIDITLYTEVDGEPTGEDTIAELQEIQASLDNATAILVAELGGEGDSVALVKLDLCGGRTCSGVGIFTKDETTAGGCSTSTGICRCPVGKWGIDCETTCSCDNGGECGDKFCHCIYPYYGFRCGIRKDCSC